jgi:hypothetical protein
MDEFFLTRVVVSFLIAGLWIAFATLLAERLGSKIGGLLTNLPSNILISLIFIALVNDTSYVIGAIPGIPVGMTINTVFLFVFIVFLNRGLPIACVASLFAWLVLAVIAAQFNFTDLFPNILVYGVVTIGVFLFLEKATHIPSVAKSSKRYTTFQILLRAVFAGGIVASIIVISKIFSPYVTGIFATFPAVLLSTMVILVLNQSAAFAKATGKILVLSSTNIVVYGIAVYYSFSTLGVGLGTLVSFVAASLWVWLLSPLLRKVS